MDYRALIQNRKSVRAFTDRYVSFDHMDQIKTYHRNSVRRLLPDVKTELRMFGLDARAVLEGAAGYKQFLVGAPQYMVLLSEKHPHAGENAGFVMEDLLLKVTDMGLDSCWLTFTDSEYIKTALEIESDLDVVAIAAFGYGEKTTRRLRLNVRSMSSLDNKAQRQYFQPKLGISYGFLIRNGRITLVEKPDSYTGGIDAKLNLGIVLLHFSAVASHWAGEITWHLEEGSSLPLPEGHRAVVSTAL